MWRGLQALNDQVQIPPMHTPLQQAKELPQDAPGGLHPLPQTFMKQVLPGQQIVPGKQDAPAAWQQSPPSQ